MEFKEIGVYLFSNFILQPIFNLLILIYWLLPFKDLALAIIFLTLILKLMLFPLSKKGIVAQKKLLRIQKEIEKHKEKFKKDPEKQAKFILELYQKEKITPASGCLPFLIQFPVLIALFQIFWKGIKEDKLDLVYSFLPQPKDLSPIALGGLLNLNSPNFALALFASLLQFWQVSKEIKEISFQGKKEALLQKQILFLMPFLTFFLLVRFPSALGVYWIANIVFSILERKLILERLDKKYKIKKDYERDRNSSKDLSGDN